MILVDTSIWVDHFNERHSELAALLEQEAIVMHPFVLGELALGNPPNRRVLLASLQKLPRVGVSTASEVLAFIEQHSLNGLGIGYVDVHLLASARLVPDTQLWTRDKRLHLAALSLSLAAPFSTIH